MNDVAMKSHGPLGPVSKVFANRKVTNELGGGIQSSFGVVGYKGRTWSIKYRGVTTPLMRKDGDGPIASIEVVIVKAPNHVAKTYYEAGYVEGSTAGPDCFSNNGVTPDPTSPKLQNNVCATCPKNAWGSKIVQAGGRPSNGKACSDVKKLVVVPLHDIPNEQYNGPMLLRVPAASLSELAMYGANLAKNSYPPEAVGTRISFDQNVAYPKFNFGAIRPLSDEEAEVVVAMQSDPMVDRILSESPVEASEPAAAPPVASIFEQPPAPIQRAAMTPPVQVVPQVVPAQVVVPMQPMPTNGSAPHDSSLEDELDSKLHELLPR